MPPQPSVFVPVARTVCQSASSLHPVIAKCYHQLKALHGTNLIFVFL